MKSDIDEIPKAPLAISQNEWLKKQWEQFFKGTDHETNVRPGIK